MNLLSVGPEPYTTGEFLRATGFLLGLGAWSLVDAAFLQLLISQPLMAGWLAGLALGEPLTGLAIGFCLQLIWMRDLPMGGRALPATGPATVVAVFLACGHRLPWIRWPSHLEFEAVHLFVVFAVALLVGETGRKVAERRARSRSSWVRTAEASAEPEKALRGLWLRGIREDALTGIALALGGLLVGGAVLTGLPQVPATAHWSGDWIVLPVLGVGLGLALSMTGRTGPLWLLGCLAAVTLGGRLLS